MKRLLLENIKPIAAFAPVASTGTAITGTVIDRQGYQSAYLVINVASGTGGSGTAVALIRVEDAKEQAFNATNATYVTLASAADIATATTLYYPIDLAGANRYIRAYEDTTYGGSMTGNVISAEFILGDKDEEPVSSTVYGNP